MYCQCCSCHQCWRTKDGTRICCSWSKLRRSFFFPPWISSLELKLVVVVARRAAGHHRCTLPSFLCWSREPPGRARTHAHTHTDRKRERRLRLDDKAVVSWLCELQKGSWSSFLISDKDYEATSTSLLIWGGYSTFVGQTFQWDFQAIRFKAWHRTTWSSWRKGETLYINLEFTKFERSEKRSGELNSWHS